MTITEIIEIIGIVVSFLLGVFSLIISVLSNKNSKKANNISEKANVLSEKSLKISKELQEEQKESIKISCYSNLKIIKNDDIEFVGNKSVDDYLLIISVELKNMSSLPVSVKRPYFYWGNKKEYIFISDDELYIPKEIQNIAEYPIYLREKEAKNIIVVIGLNSSERLQLYSNSGITISFSGNENTYYKYLDCSTIIDNISE